MLRGVPLSMTNSATARAVAILATLLLCGPRLFAQHDHDHTAASTQPALANDGRRVLRVAADPNNLPFSNDRGEGFENKIAELVARELNAELRYVWRAHRRGFCRETLKEGNADLVVGLPTRFEQALTTSPYYRSTFAFVQRTDSAVPAVRSFDDERLRALRVGVQLVGDDGANPPPAHALAARGVIDNVRGYTVFGDYREPNPPARVVEAVARGEVDVACVWGPLAGYFAKRQAVGLTVTPVEVPVDPRTRLPMTFAISMGVSRQNAALRDELNAVIERRGAEIDAILDEYGVPRVTKPAGAARGSHDEDDEDDD
jgi:mxaJ protein